jgi:hypothetical protein
VQQSFAKWWRRAPVCLGFSVNAQSMTLVEWCPVDLAQAPLERWAQEVWTPGEKQDGKPGLSAWEEPAQLAQLGAAVRTAWQRAGMRCRRLAMGLPSELMVQQTLQLDADLPARELRAQVNWSASQALDLAWDEVAFDFRIDKPADAQAAQPGTSLTVTWLACPMTLVQAAQQMSLSAGLRLQFLGVESAHMPLSEDAASDLAGLSPQWHLACEMARQGSIA